MVYAVGANTEYESFLGLYVLFLEVKKVTFSWHAFIYYSSYSKISGVLTLYYIEDRENGRRLAADIFKCIFLNEIFWLCI